MGTFELPKDLSPINAHTIEHPGRDKPAQPQENDSIPQLEGFDPNENNNSNVSGNVNAPLGNLML